MLKKIIPLLLIAIFPLLSNAQESEAAHIRFSFGETEGLEVGDKVSFRVEVSPKAGWHVYSALPSEDDAYIPTSITFDLTSRNFEADEKIGEEGSMHSEYDDIMGGTMRYYKGKVVFTKELTITGPEMVVAGSFDYMACNEYKCIPLMEEFSVKLNLK